MEIAPVALFVYNRPWHARETVTALRRNELAEKSELFVFCDGPSDESQRDYVRQVREYIRTIDGFRKVTVVEQPENLGLAASIIGGVKRVVNEYGKVIVLEDDLVTSPFFLNYMNDALNVYQNEEKVMHVTGYIFPVEGELPETFFIRGTGTWGWGTWKRAWCRFNPNGQELLDQITKSDESVYEFNLEGSYNYLDMLRGCIDGRNDSWGVRWYASVFLAGGYGLWPNRSLVRNIGFDISGVHCGRTDRFNAPQLAEYVAVNRAPIVECKAGRMAVIRFYENLHKDTSGPKQRIASRLRNVAYRLGLHVPAYLKELIKSRILG